MVTHTCQGPRDVLHDFKQARAIMHAIPFDIPHITSQSPQWWSCHLMAVVMAHMLTGDRITRQVHLAGWLDGGGDHLEKSKKRAGYSE